jgi:hypothetical protein
VARISTYQAELFRFDQLYRHFNRATEFVEPMGWAVLHELKQRIEASYSGWFIPQLSSAWGKILEGEAGLLSSWRIPGVINQQNFFDKVLLPLSDGGTKRVTADHGFMYQESALEEADKSTLSEKPEGTIVAKKRYLLGQGIGSNPKAWSGNTALTAGTEPVGSLDFWIPKGANRFHFTGGARFVHGSAMPQEIVVPVIAIRSTESELAKTKVVSISLLGASNKVVTNTQRFEFIQNEAVSERVLPRALVISLRDGDQPISNEQTITFDSTSQLLDERKRSLLLTVLSGSYDRNKDYYLVARDAATKVEVLRAPVKVDLAFSNDF